MKPKNKILLIGNWKMNPDTIKKAVTLTKGIIKVSQKSKNIDWKIAAPSIFVSEILRNVPKGIIIGTQNINEENSGAFTGEISLLQTKSVGSSFSIVGHSERRALGETNENINKKIINAFSFKHPIILCVGERERDSEGFYLVEIKKQLEIALKDIKKETLKYLTVAYEPVWSIGKNAKAVATYHEALEINIFIKRVLSDLFGEEGGKKVKIIYGGSANSSNMREFIDHANVDGFLLGRASLDIKEITKIHQELNK
jgi:triosephosphate isomerase